MFKKLAIAMSIIAGSFGSLYAQEEEAKKLEYGVAIDVGSTYLWRGYDVLQAAAPSGSVMNFAPAIFPSVTVGVKDTGFSFNVWSSFALTERSASASELESADEVDLTATYSIEDKSGTFTSAFIGYVYPTTGSGGLLSSYPEFLLSYGAPVVLTPTVGVATAFGNAGGSTEYTFLTLSHEIEAGKLTINPTLTFGVWFFNEEPSLTKGHLDLAIPVGFKISESFEAHLSLIGSYRIAGYDDNGAPFILVAVLGASGSF